LALIFALVFSIIGLVARAATLPFVQVKADVSAHDLESIKEIGFHGIRLGIRREKVTDEGWQNYDRVVGGAADLGLEILGVAIDGSPTIIKGAEYPGFPAFFADAVKRYPAVRTWEIWNEPDNPTFWPRGPKAARFANLAIAACQAGRAVAPDAAIYAGGLTDHSLEPPYPGGFIKKLAPLTKTGCLTGITIHPYRRQAPESVVHTLARLRKDFPQVRFAISEWGYTRAQSMLRHPYDPSYQARLLLSGRLAEVPFVSLYEWKDSGDDPSEGEHRYGLVDREGREQLGAKIVRVSLPWVSRGVNCKAVENGVYCLQDPDGEKQLLWANKPESPNGDDIIGPFPHVFEIGGGQ